MANLVLLRHGQSVWNRENRFTGWTDVGLTEQGEREAHRAAKLLAGHGYGFDRCFVSVLKRAIKTQWIVLEDMDLMWLPSEKHWRLNERHYGALQGADKDETARRYGEDQVFCWRRSFDEAPPALEPEDPRHPGLDPRYRDLDVSLLPLTESLRMTTERVIPFWRERIAPLLQQGLRVLVSAHGNSLRGLVKYLDAIPDEEIPGFEIPTGVPLIYDIRADGSPGGRFFLREEGEHRPGADTEETKR